MGLSTHILDTARGRPAAGVPLVLSRLDGDWTAVGTGMTDRDGRCHTLLGAQRLEQALYRLEFQTAAYFEHAKTTSLYPYVHIIFTVSEPDEHLHIPLLIAPNGYTTYRGS